MGHAVLVSATCKKSNQVKKNSCFHKCGFYEFLLKKNLQYLLLGLIFEDIKHPLHQKISHRVLSSWLAEKPVAPHARSHQHTEQTRKGDKMKIQFNLGAEYQTTA